MARRRTKEKGMFEAIYSILPKSEEMTEEETDKKKASGELREMTMYLLNLYDLLDRLVKEYGGRRTEIQCARKAKFILDNIPKEITPNLIEWLDCESISEIRVCGTSVNEVLEEAKQIGANIIDVFECFAHWNKDNHYQDPNFCHNYFAIL